MQPGVFSILHEIQVPVKTRQALRIGWIWHTGSSRRITRSRRGWRSITIWRHLFGRGLVGTAMNDFGVRGETPTHPELLDWLAGEYIRLGWSRKALIRTIVLSQTYRRSSQHRTGTGGRRSTESVVVSTEPGPGGSGNGAGPVPLRQRPARPPCRRPQRVSDTAARYCGTELRQ